MCVLCLSSPGLLSFHREADLRDKFVRIVRFVGRYVIDIEHAAVRFIAVFRDPGGYGGDHLVDLCVAALKGASGVGHGRQGKIFRKFFRNFQDMLPTLRFFSDPLDKGGISAYTITHVAYGSRIERYHRIEAWKGVLRNDGSCFLRITASTGLHDMPRLSSMAARNRSWY